jgi:hypothetical protein
MRPVAEAHNLPFDQALESVDLLSGVMFTDFVFFSFLGSRFGAEGVNPAEAYLKASRWRTTPTERSFLQALPHLRPSLYEVLSVRPGNVVRLRNLLEAGEPVEVWDALASNGLLRWDCLIARLWEHQGRWRIVGMPLPLTPVQGARLQAIEEDAEAGSGRARLSAWAQSLGGVRAAALARAADATFLAAYWLDEQVAEANTPEPELFNSDGDPLHPQVMVFKFAAQQRDAVRARLAEHADCQAQDDDGEHWCWLRKGPELAPRDLGDPDADGYVVDTFDANGTVVAWMALEADLLLVTVNSEARARAAQECFAKRLHGLARFASCVDSDDPTLDALAAGAPGTETEDWFEPDDEDFTDQAVAMRRGFLDAHYRRWLDMALPALAGMTPRQAAQDGPGRRRLIVILKELENAMLAEALESDEPAYRTDWLWGELGLEQESA